MTKIGRNEPCPCGSGKKYKKCCGINIVENYDVNAVNDELYAFHGELISFTNNHFVDVIDKQAALYEHAEEMDEIYKTGLVPWIVTKLPLPEENNTIFQSYIQEKRNSLSLTTRQTLLRWIESEPSIYEVIAVDEPKPGFVQVQDIAGKKEIYNIPYNDAEHYPKGGLVSGVIVPFLEHENFLFSMIRLFNENKVHFQKLILKHNHYPSLLRDVLNDGLFEAEWLQPQHEEVADLFATYADEQGHENKSIAEGIIQWNDYCKKTNPSIQKSEPHAAALTYFFEKDLMHNDDVRQAQVAEAFGTSPSTLSAIYRRITEELNNE